MFRVLASSDKRFACNASASGDLLRRLFLGGFCRVTVGLAHRCFHLRLIRLKAEGDRFDSPNPCYVN